MSRTAHRLLSSSLRSSTRANLDTATRSSRTALARRMMSSGSHASHGGSDTPWIIGSALVFGPLFLYLVSPSARKGSHEHTEHAHKNHRDTHEGKHGQHAESHEDVTPIADDEGTEVSGQEVKESMEKAFEVDSPKDAQEREEVQATTDIGDNSITATQSHTESLADATPISGSELNPAASAPIRVDEGTHPTSDESAESTVGDKSGPPAESKAEGGIARD